MYFLVYLFPDDMDILELEVIILPDNELIFKIQQPRGEYDYQYISCRLKKETVKRLDDLASQLGSSRNSIIVRLINHGLETYRIDTD